MALFESQLITAASGSVGGLTFSRNAGGLYIRARAVPVNPATPQQELIRAAVASLTVRWNDNLTAGQRAGWEVYASNVQVINKLGLSKFISGIAHYIRSNVPRRNVGVARVDDAPTVFNLSEFTDPALTVASEAVQTISVSFDNTDAWAIEDDGAMVVQISRPQNQSINFFNGPYRAADAILGAVIPPGTPAAVSVPFAFVAGQRLFTRIRTFRADGRLASAVRDFIDTVA